MRILQIITLSDLGGAQSVVVELSNALIKKGHEVQVMSNPHGQMWESLAPEIRSIKSNYFQRKISALKEIKTLFSIKKQIRLFKPDIIHLHSSKIGVLGRIAAMPFLSTKVVYTVHGFDSIRRANRVFLPLEKLLQKSCKKIVAVSKYDLENLHKEGVVSNTCMIYNSVKEPQRMPLEDDILAAITKQRQMGKKIILNISRDAPPKRIDLYEKVAIEMKNEPISFFWIGNNESSITDENIICLGEISNARKYLPFCDIFVLLSDFEGLPMSILEAMAEGKPIVASNVGGIPELLSSNEGFASENNIDAICDKIKLLATDEVTYNEVSQASRNRYIRDFRIDKMTEEYIKIYEE